MRTVKFGIIGIGLMGREFASAVMRWPHLPSMTIKPEVVAICGNPISEQEEAWYRRALPTIGLVTADYRELLAEKEIEAVYCAVPHFLHEQIYIDCIEAEKHLLGEKPFGIDMAANSRIMQAVARHPDVLVRCSSEFPFAPAMQRLCAMIREDAFGRILEVEAGFLHSSDLDIDKPINWKRRAEFNGAYGCMGDLGMHVCHVPFRAGWIPMNVRALLENIVPERPDGKGGMAPCDTWDNATLLCQTQDRKGDVFPMTLKMHRIAPGEKNTWYLTVKGTKSSARFTTKHINSLEFMRYDGTEQYWCTLDMGHETAFPSITGGIFEFGFSDAVLQMWASFLSEIEKGESPAGTFTQCVTPGETALSHALFTAALESETNASVVDVKPFSAGRT